MPSAREARRCLMDSWVRHYNWPDMWVLDQGAEFLGTDFNVWSNGFSVIYCGVASANVLFGNKLPSAVLLVAGPIHQYLYWLFFAYFKGNVLGSHPLGVMNWITTIIVGTFTIDMVAKTWLLSFNPNFYLNYASKKNKVIEIDSQENHSDKNVIFQSESSM